MAPKSLAALLLSSLLYSTTTAFVPLNIHPPIDNSNLQPQAQPKAHPSLPDPAHWAPIATLAPVTSIPSSTPTPSPSSDEYNILPILDPFSPPDLRKRQGAPAAAPAPQPTVAGQISPVTTYMVNSEVAPGSFAQVPVIYTQTFPPIPDQWAPAVAGTVGLGTIQGTVGGVRSKRDVAEPTQVPAVEVERVTRSWSA